MIAPPVLQVFTVLREQLTQLLPLVLLEAIAQKVLVLQLELYVQQELLQQVRELKLFQNAKSVQKGIIAQTEQSANAPQGNTQTGFKSKLKLMFQEQLGVVFPALLATVVHHWQPKILSLALRDTIQLLEQLFA